MCQYCGVKPDTQDGTDFIKLLECANCLIDIEAMGQWTGYGWESLLSLVKKFGYPFISSYLQKILNEYGRPPKMTQEIIDKLKQESKEAK